MAAAAGRLSFGSGAAFAMVAGVLGCAHGRAAPRPSSLAPALVGGSEAASFDALDVLRRWEAAARVRTDFSRVPTSDIALGPDPYVVRRIGAAGSSEGHFVGILRGRSAVVELDGALHEVRRLAAPASPTGLAVGAGGEVYVVGEQSSRVARFRTGASGLEPAGFTELEGVRAMRDVALGPEGVVYVVEEHDGRLLTFRPGADDDSAPGARADNALCHGPLHVQRVAKSVIVDCLLDHQVVIRTVDSRGYPVEAGEVRISRDGPIWGIDAIARGADIVLALGGVEDHPLDRSEGSFGFIDSFVTLYTVGAGGTATKLSDVNTSAFGVVTPKALRLSSLSAGKLELVVAAYGSDRIATLDWTDGAAPPAVSTRSIPPGSAMIDRSGDGTWLIANPLLDAWVRVTPTESVAVPVDDDRRRERSASSRLGEALFFTTLMAPWNQSEGRLSRFTCEACHFEGYVDGRTHRTGRGDIVATTKPLTGLFNNRPHFSRALDPDLTTMVNNEFRVAGAKSSHDPWFSLAIDDVPWVSHLGIDGRMLTPEMLRRSLMTFFMDFSPRPNPAVAGRAHWNDIEAAGARVFLRKCESCHQARLVADDAATRVAFPEWEGRVMAPAGAIVWARAEYAKTGVVPYVNERGARVVSLRRLYKKYPYFTNGTAKSVAAVLDRVRFAGDEFFHDGAPESAEGLAEDEKAQLGAFLDLL